MDPDTIREARRILRDLIFQGRVTLKSGRIVEPKDEVFTGIVEKVASKKVEEAPEAPTVEGFAPRETYHAKVKDAPEGDVLVQDRGDSVA